MSANGTGDEPYDALQRTSLSWVRTGLGLVVCALLTVRLGVVNGQPVAASVAGGCGLGAAGLAVLQSRRRSVAAAGRALPVLTTAALVGLAGITAFVLILLAA